MSLIRICHVTYTSADTMQVAMSHRKPLTKVEILKSQLAVKYTMHNDYGAEF